MNLERADQKQEELLVELIERLSNTRYGEKYQISENSTYDDFRAKVPVVVYEDLKPWIDRNMAGNSNCYGLAILCGMPRVVELQAMCPSLFP